MKMVLDNKRVEEMGDVQQLTPIGNCQVFADILDSNVLPVVKLSKPHRQALRSGIIPTSIKIANQQQIFDGNYTGNTVIGELKDMEFDISGKRNEESISDKIIKHFQIELEKFHDVMEVQVCVPMRLRGELSCYNLNSKIQSIYNPKLNDGNEIEIFLEKKKDETKKYTIRVGDVYTIADQLKSCPACPSYVGRTMTKHDTSKGKCCPDAIANALIDMYKEMKNSIFSDDIETSNVKSKVIKKNTEDKEQSVNVKNPCPVCGEELTFEGGCNVCKACGWSKCD